MLAATNVANPQVQTMSNFVSQIKSMADSAAAGAVASETSMSGAPGGSELGMLGNVAAIAGGSYAAQAAAAPGASLLGSPVLNTSASAAPAVDTLSVNNALSQATAALQAAGATSSSLSTFSGVPLAGTSVPPGGFTAEAGGAYGGNTIAMAVPAGGALSSAASQVWIAWAIQILGGDANNPKVVRLAQQYGPMLQEQAATKTPAEMNKMYHRYRGYLQKRLGLQLPANLPPLPRSANAPVSIGMTAPNTVSAASVPTGAQITTTPGSGTAAPVLK
jgi:hypothetical protein